MRFVDTSFWIALQIRRDAHHAAARQIWQGQHEPLITTNLVIGETWTWLNRRLGHYAAVDFVELTDRSPRVTVRRVDEHVEREAWDWLRRHDERVYSFVDATSFALIRALGIFEALAFDGDFSAAGFVEVRP